MPTAGNQTEPADLPAQNHLVQSGVGGQRSDGGLPILETPWFLAVRVVPSETVSAMDGTRAGRDQERPAGVFLEQPRRGAGRAVFHRVQPRLRRLVKLIR